MLPNPRYYSPDTKEFYRTYLEAYCDALTIGIKDPQLYKEIV